MRSKTQELDALSAAAKGRAPAGAGAGVGSQAGSIKTGALYRAPRSFSLRLWRYQRERFPLVGHGLLIFAFSSSAVSFSSLLRGATPALSSLVMAFVSSLFFFFQLRVADEFKDFQEDARWRPYRPVPRGLIALPELAAVALVGGMIQATFAVIFSWRLAVLLLLVWTYLALMTKEFFLRDWLVQRPITYLWTHMLVIPMADFYATACDWSKAGSGPPAGLSWFLAASFWNGINLELGRKMRSPEDEEAGVCTYTILWGRRRAVAAWFGVLCVTALCASAAARAIDFFWPGTIGLGTLLLSAAFLAVQFTRQPSSKRAKAIETFSGVWTLVMYFSLGLVPFLRAWARHHP